MHGTDAHRSRHRPRGYLARQAHPLDHLPGRAGREREKHFAHLDEDHAFTDALEQRTAHLVVPLSPPVREGRLRDLHPFRRAGETRGAPVPRCGAGAAFRYFPNSLLIKRQYWSVRPLPGALVKSVGRGPSGLPQHARLLLASMIS